MIDYNDSTFDLISRETKSSKISISKNAYQGIKKDFDKLMIDGYKKSFSVVHNADSNARGESLSNVIHTNISENIGDIVDKETSTALSTNNYEIIKAIENKSKVPREINISNNKMHATNINGYVGKLAAEFTAKNSVGFNEKINMFYVKQHIIENNKNIYDDGVSLILSDGEYVLNIHGKFNMVDSSNVLEYIKYFHNEYELNIKKVYVNNKLIFDEKSGTRQSSSVDKDDSSFNYYF